MIQSPHTIPYHWLEESDYAAIWQKLQQRAEQIAHQQQQEVIWSCEHDPIYTTGRRALDNRLHDTLPAPWIITDRGGETTFHGPGQIMLYPIIDLRRRGITVRQYIHLLEQATLQLLQQYNIQAERQCNMPGVWVGERKIAAMGVRVARGVAYHGMALNLSVDLRYFQAINPCGLGREAINFNALCSTPFSPKAVAKTWAHELITLLS